jgi:hypothetical protein
MQRDFQNGQGGLPAVANGPNSTNNPVGATNGNRRPGSPTTNGGGPPTPGPSDLVTPGPGGAPYPVFPAAYIDPSNGAFLRGVPPVRLMQPGPLLYNNQVSILSTSNKRFSNKFILLD